MSTKEIEVKETKPEEKKSEEEKPEKKNPETKTLFIKKTIIKEPPTSVPHPDDIINKGSKFAQGASIFGLILFSIVILIVLLTAIPGFIIAFILAVIAEYRFYKEKRILRPFGDALKLNWFYILYYIQLGKVL
jgi:hypothetical protein